MDPISDKPRSKWLRFLRADTSDANVADGGGQNGDAARGDLPRRVRRQIFLSKCLLFAERCLRRSWPGSGPFGVILVFSLLNFWSVLPEWGRMPVAILLGGLGCFWLARDLRHLRWPTRADAIQRLDRTGLTQSGQSNPLSSYEDRMAQLSLDKSDPDTEALWALHKERLNEAIGRLKLQWPQDDIARRDPRAWRVVLLLGLCLGMFLSWGQFQPWLGFTSIWRSGEDEAVRPLVAWVSPPDYTRLPPIYLTQNRRGLGTEVSLSDRQGADGILRVPLGSVLFARVDHPSKPRLVLNREADTGLFFDRSGGLFGGLRKKSGADGEQVDALEFTSVEAGVHELFLPLNEPLKLQLKLGFNKISEWRFDVVPDIKPAAGFTDDLSASDNLQIQVPYVVLDDYGVVSAQTIIRRTDLAEEQKISIDAVRGKAASQTEAAGLVDEEKIAVDEEATALDHWLRAPVMLDLDLGGTKPTRQNEVFRADLTAHPWAGFKVSVQLRAEDDLGQIGVSDEHSFILPEREFRSPMAKAVIEQRKYLYLHPLKAKRVASVLDALMDYPEIYQPDARVYLSMRVASTRLKTPGSLAEIQNVHSMLWDIALQIEDGGRQRMEERMRELQQQLSDAIAEGRPKDEIDEIMQALQDMIGEYLAQLMEKSKEAMEKGELPAFDPGAQTMSSADMQKLLDAIEEMLRLGDAEGAMEALADLMNMLQGLEFAMPSGSGQGFPMPGDPSMNETLSELGEVINRQRNLMDETFRQGQEGPPNSSEGQPGEGGSSDALETQQQALREKLDETLNKLGQNGDAKPQELDRAERAMRDAEEALKRGDNEQAVQSQQEAIDQLREGTQSLAREMLNERMKKFGQRGQGGNGAEARDLDPLGRPSASSGPEFGDSVNVPDESELKRAREILDELRRRSGERHRPEPELDYLDRLLPKF